MLMMLCVRLQVRPFIRTEETKSKIVFLSGSDRAAALHEHIPSQVSINRIRCTASTGANSHRKYASKRFDVSLERVIKWWEVIAQRSGRRAGATELCLRAWRAIDPEK